jgi:hypothetical protein
MVVLALALGAIACRAQSRAPANPEPQPSSERRILWLVPAYDVTPASAKYQPLSARQKLHLFTDDTFDRWTIVKAAGDAGIGQLANRPHYGQGAVGYAKRFGAAVGDSVSEDFFTSFAFPALLKQDPRYFRLGPGSTGRRRFIYALDRVFVTRRDTGGSAANFSFIFGTAAATALSNAYYPERDQTVSYTLVRFGERIAVQGAENVAKEFWPGIRKHIPGQH